MSLSSRKRGSTRTFRTMLREEVAPILKMSSYKLDSSKSRSIGKSARDLEIQFDDKETQESILSQLSDYREKTVTSYFRFPIFPVIINFSQKFSLNFKKFPLNQNAENLRKKLKLFKILQHGKSQNFENSKVPKTTLLEQIQMSKKVENLKN